MLGYLSARLTTTEDEVQAARTTLRGFAEREGYALAEIFEERDVNAPTSALAALIGACQRQPVAVVAIPSLINLSPMPRVQSMTIGRIQDEGGVSVLVAQQ